jgi:hypothetical protein
VGGVAIISGEARDLTVIYIVGNMTVKDLEKLGGNMGIPHINLGGARKILPEKKEDE